MDTLDGIELLNLDPASEFLVSGLCAGLLEPIGFVSVGSEWYLPYLDRHYHILTALNEVLDGCGIETILDHNESHGAGLALYINNGRTYQATVLYDNDRGVFEVSSYGDFYNEWIRGQAENWNRYQCPNCSHLTELEGEPPYPSGAGISCGNCNHLLFD